MAEWYFDAAQNRWVGTDSRYAAASESVPQNYTTSWSTGSGFNQPATQVPLGAAQANAQLGTLAGQNQIYSGNQQLLGRIPTQMTDPHWARRLIQSGQWRRQDNGSGGFWVYNQYGQRIGGFSPNAIYDSEFNAQGDWVGSGMPAGAVELLGSQPTMAREAQEFQQGFSNRSLQQAMDIARMGSADSRYAVDTSSATSRYATDINSQTNRYTAELSAAVQRESNANQMAIAQLNDATRRLESQRQYEIQTGQLALARQTEARIAQNEQQRIALETRQIGLNERQTALNERVAGAQMAAEPRNWVANAFFLRGQVAPDGSMGLSSPGAQPFFQAQNAMAAAAPGAMAGGSGAPVGAPAVDTTSENRAVANQTALGFDPNTLPWLRGVRGDGQLQSFGPTAASGNTTIGATVPQPTQVNFTNFAKLLPSEQQMYAGLVTASGQSPDDYFELMRRAAPLGQSRGAQRWGF